MKKLVGLLKYPPPNARLRDWKDNRRWKRLLRDARYFANYIAEDLVTAKDGEAIEGAEIVERFLINEWGVVA